MNTDTPFTVPKIQLSSDSERWTDQRVPSRISKAKRSPIHYVNNRGAIKVRYITDDGLLVSNSNHDDELWIVRKRGGAHFISIHMCYTDVLSKWPPADHYGLS